MYFVNISMPLNLRLNLCFLQHSESCVGVRFSSGKCLLTFFSHFWQSSGAGCGPFITYFFFLIQQMFALSFLFHSTNIYCYEASTILFSLLTTSKTQKMRGKKQISIRPLHLSKPTRPVAYANETVL